MVWPVLACNVHKTNILTPGIRAFSLSVPLMVSQYIGLTVMNLKFKISSAHTTTYTASVWPVTGAGTAATPRTDGSEINFRKLLNSSSASLGRQRIKTGPPVVWWSHCRKKHRLFVRSCTECTITELCLDFWGSIIGRPCWTGARRKGAFSYVMGLGRDSCA